MTTTNRPRPAARLTPKQRVLKKYPDAFSYDFQDCVCIYRPYAGGNLDLGTGKTAQAAWAAAAKALRRKKRAAAERKP